MHDGRGLPQDGKAEKGDEQSLFGICGYDIHLLTP